MEQPSKPQKETEKRSF